MNENHDEKGQFASGPGGGSGKAKVRNLSSNQRLAMGITDNRDAPERAVPTKDATPKDVRQRLAQGITDNRDAHTNMDKTTNTAHAHTDQPSVVGMTRYSPGEHPNAQQRAAAAAPPPKKMTVLQKRLAAARARQPVDHRPSVVGVTRYR